MIASYKGKVFQVSWNKVYTIDGLTWGGSIDTEVQEHQGGKPSTYIKGLGLDTLSFDIPLRADLGHNVRAEIEWWQKIRDSKTPDIFMLGSKPLGSNKWLVKSVNASDIVLDGAGRMIKATLKIEIEEYVRAGKKPPETSSGERNTVSAGLVPNEIYAPPTKYEDKRSNPHYDDAIAMWLY